MGIVLLQNTNLVQYCTTNPHNPRKHPKAFCFIQVELTGDGIGISKFLQARGGLSGTASN
jgi:hypothetical protein